LEHWQVTYVTAGTTVVMWLRGVEQQREKVAGVPQWHVESRFKERESIERKIARKRECLPHYSLSDMNDLMGVRVIVESVSCARSLAKLLKHYQPFEIGGKECFTDTPRADGYRGIHFVLRVPNRLPPPSGHDQLLEVSVELQIRSILQHQWSVLSHSDFYKQISEIPLALLARMRSLSEILHSAEVESDQLRRGRVLDECSNLIRLRLRGRVLEQLVSEGVNPREIGEKALHLLEFDQQLRRTLVSEGEEQRRGFEALESLARNSEDPSSDVLLREDLRQILRRVRAVVDPLLANVPNAVI
jgi:putative GTP pyrophosphokinase